jgi:methyltransferase-like protein 6
VHDFEWNEEMEENCKKIIESNMENMIEEEIKANLDQQGKNWEKFYKFNKTNFFKDRHYILREFLELKNDESVSILIMFRRR